MAGLQVRGSTAVVCVDADDNGADDDGADDDDDDDEGADDEGADDDVMTVVHGDHDADEEGAG